MPLLEISKRLERNQRETRERLDAEKDERETGERWSNDLE